MDENEMFKWFCYQKNSERTLLRNWNVSPILDTKYIRVMSSQHYFDKLSHSQCLLVVKNWKCMEFFFTIEYKIIITILFENGTCTRFGKIARTIWSWWSWIQIICGKNLLWEFIRVFFGNVDEKMFCFLCMYKWKGPLER